MTDDPRPLPPPEPEPWECCQSGCDPCVYDRYWQELEQYEAALAQWLRRNPPQNGMDATSANS